MILPQVIFIRFFFYNVIQIIKPTNSLSQSLSRIALFYFVSSFLCFEIIYILKSYFIQVRLDQGDRLVSSLPHSNPQVSLLHLLEASLILVGSCSGKSRSDLHYIYVFFFNVFCIYFNLFLVSSFFEIACLSIFLYIHSFFHFCFLLK